MRVGFVSDWKRVVHINLIRATTKKLQPLKVGGRGTAFDHVTKSAQRLNTNSGTKVDSSTIIILSYTQFFKLFRGDELH